MPIYEFRCGECSRITSHFTRKMDAELKVPCEHCASQKTFRMMSKFGRTFSQADIMEKYGDPSDRGIDAYRDPRQIGTWVEKRFEEYGMDLPDGAREMIDAAREGEFPEPVKDL